MSFPDNANLGGISEQWAHQAAAAVSPCRLRSRQAMTSLGPEAGLNHLIKLWSERQSGLNCFPSWLLTFSMKGSVSLKGHTFPEIPQGWGHSTYGALDKMRVESCARSGTGKVYLVLKSCEHGGYCIPPGRSCRAEESEDLTHFQKADVGDDFCRKGLL